MTELINTTPLEFTELQDIVREYVYVVEGQQVVVRIQRPRFLNVNPHHGAHRIVDADGTCHYLPSGWLTLRWEVEEGTPHFHTTVAQPDGTAQQVKLY